MVLARLRRIYHVAPEDLDDVPLDELLGMLEDLTTLTTAETLTIEGGA